MVKQYNIIGFSQYTISSDCVVVTKSTGQIKATSNVAGARNKYFYLTGDDGKRYGLSEARLLYCAVKEIPPLKIKKNGYIFSFNGKGKAIKNIVIKEPWEAGHNAHKLRKMYLPDKKTYYGQVIAFSKAILADDTEKIYAEINRHEAEIKRAIHKYTTNTERINRIYNKVINDFIISIKDGDKLIFHPLFYLRCYIRKSVSNNRHIYLVENDADNMSTDARRVKMCGNYTGKGWRANLFTTEAEGDYM
jgi:hypothetical protein